MAKYTIFSNKQKVWYSLKNISKISFYVSELKPVLHKITTIN